MNCENFNPAKKAMREGKKVSAAWLQAGSTVTAEIVARAGFDVGIIDMEHGPGDIMCLMQQIQAMQGQPTVPFVRAPWNDMVIIKRILDAGAYGLIVPYVNTKEEVEYACRAAQYPTAGIRGIAGSPRAGHFGVNSKEYFSKANEEIFIFTQVETPKAVENLDAILTVDRLDGVFIGPMDLSTSMGHFANPGAPEVQEVIAGIEKKVLAAGKILGTVAGSWEDAAQKYQRGYSLIISFSDTVNLAMAAGTMVASFRHAYPA
ncbi:MAG: 2,4-dihydroxyhept-2-ene-1,7-dioic acid aldolase [Planctomycetes bacterium]|nr:2,4-dihydroxyhept-2-ene-1,7-dioic acid aldolase [Planctomycetota bacterium]